MIASAYVPVMVCFKVDPYVLVPVLWDSCPLSPQRLCVIPQHTPVYAARWSPDFCSYLVVLEVLGKGGSRVGTCC